MSDQQLDTQHVASRSTLHSTRHDPATDSSARFGTNMATALFVILGGVLTVSA